MKHVVEVCGQCHQKNKIQLRGSKGSHKCGKCGEEIFSESGEQVEAETAASALNPQYQDRALPEIVAWLDEKEGVLSKGAGFVGKGLAKPFGMIPNSVTDPITAIVSKSFMKVIDGVDWAFDAQSVREDVQKRVEKKSVCLFEGADLTTVSLKRKYVAAGGTLGAATGGVATINPLAALSAMAVELPTLLALQVTTIQAITAAYGYDPADPKERLASLSIMNLASCYEEERRAEVNQTLQGVARMDPDVVALAKGIVSGQTTRPAGTPTTWSTVRWPASPAQPPCRFPAVGPISRVRIVRPTCGWRAWLHPSDGCTARFGTGGKFIRPCQLHGHGTVQRIPWLPAMYPDREPIQYCPGS